MNWSPRRQAEMINYINYRPFDVNRAMIRIKEPAKPPGYYIPRPLNASCTFHRLPLEVHHMIVENLDFSSVYKLLQVSLHGLAIVQSSPVFQEIWKHAPDVVTALGQTGLLSYYTLESFHRLLYDDRCGLCPEYGAYLYIPTGKRCCWACLNSKISLQAITTREAKKTFKLKKEHLEMLPILHSIPGNYPLSLDTKKSYPLVHVGAAWALSIMLRGPSPRGGPYGLEKTVHGLSSMSRRKLISNFITRQPSRAGFTADIFFGMTTIPLPVLRSPVLVEQGYWCRGCRLAYDLYHYGNLDESAFRVVVPDDCYAPTHLEKIARMARSRPDFLNHIKHCYGVKKLLQVRRYHNRPTH